MIENIPIESLIAQDKQHVWHPFTQEMTAPPATAIATARGASLYDCNGNSYLDLISSWWVITHGHAHPKIAQAIAHQAQTLDHVLFAGFTHLPAVTLATALVKKLPPGLERVFFSDNGSTSVEVALKMARQYWFNQGKERHRFLAFAGGYHGDTVGAMSAGHSSGFFAPFRSMLFSVDLIPYPDTWEGDSSIEIREETALNALEIYLEQHPGECAAFLAEPLVQGASGMRMCRPLFLQRLADRLKAAGILLIFDEVMTGFGRTGSLFAAEKAGVTPDIICLSKGLTGGFLPMSVTVCHQKIYEAFLGETFDRAFAHGHSFTANPISCAASVASLTLFDEEDTLSRIATLEAVHRQRLLSLANHPRLSHPRVMGSIAAFDIPASDAGYASSTGLFLRSFFLERGFLLRPLGNTLYLLPPYCITPAELHRAWDTVEVALNVLE